ncbi:MAG: hypothetical protein WBB73_04180 [Candidatus Aminicenantaceae bacterium]
MRRLISMSLAGLLLVSLVTAPGFGQSASDILEKMIEASGGRKALEAIKDTTMVGEMDMPSMGMSASMTIYHKEPNKFRQDMEVMGMQITNAFDGEVGWMLNPQAGGVQDMPSDALEEAKKRAFEFGNSAFLNPEKYGISYEFKGKEKIEDKEYFVLVQTFPNDEINTMYIDTKTNLLHLIKQKATDMMGAPTDQEMIFSDYRKVDGILASYSMTIFQGGEEFGLFTLMEIKFNSGLEDSLFAKEK